MSSPQRARRNWRRRYISPVVLDVFSLLLQSVKTAPLSAYTLADNSKQAARATPKGSLCLLCAACCNMGCEEHILLHLIRLLQAPHPTKTIVGCSAPSVRAATSLTGCPPAGRCLTLLKALSYALRAGWVCLKVGLNRCSYGRYDSQGPAEGFNQLFST